MSRPRVTLYLDVVSPYTRVAFEVLKRYEEPWDIELVFKAVSLRAVMDECGNHGPTMGISQKRNQTIKDVSRATQYYDVTLNSPPSFPFPTRPAQLLLRHLSDHPSPSVQAKYVKAIEACFTATWTTHAPLGNAEQVQSAVSSVWGQDGQDELKKLIEESSTPEMVERQEREGKALVNEGGAYGFPWMTVEKDGTTSTWFGLDRFDLRSSVALCRDNLLADAYLPSTTANGRRSRQRVEGTLPRRPSATDQGSPRSPEGSEPRVSAVR